MKFTILVHESSSDFSARTDAARKDAYWAAYRAYTTALTEAGVMTGGAALQSADHAMVVRQRGGNRQVQDGPYADAKEQLGGFYVIDVSGLDAALDWAARCPAAATGVVEVRPNYSP